MGFDFRKLSRKIVASLSATWCEDLKSNVICTDVSLPCGPRRHNATRVTVLLSMILPDELAAVQLFNIYLSYNGTQKFITVFTRNRQWTVSESLKTSPYPHTLLL
jgi:hypothetical protein